MIARRPSLIIFLATGVLLVAVMLACKGGGAVTNPLLENLLSAPTDEKFSEQFFTHGPIREEELPAIFEATTSRTDYRRRNGANLLCATIKGNTTELQQRVILETSYVEIWAIELDCSLDRNESLAGKRPEMIKAALADSNPQTLAVGLRAATLSNYPGAHEEARNYLDHKDAKVRAAAISGLTPGDVRELMPRLKQMIAEENDETTWLLMAKSLIRTNDNEATDIIVKRLEQLKAKHDPLWLHFFNELALFTAPDPQITKLLFLLARGQSSLRDEAFSVFSRWVWAKHLDPKPEVVQMCIDEINHGNLSTDPSAQPEAKPEQKTCEDMLSFMHDGKNPIGNFKGRIRGKDAVDFAEKWMKEDQHN